MKPWRQSVVRFGGATFLLAPALVVACSGDPPSVDTSQNDEGRVELGSSSLARRNFDGRERHNAAVRFDEAKARSRLTGRLAASDVAATFDPATGVTRTLKARTGFLTDPSSSTPEAIAIDFARSNADALGLTGADLAGMEVTDIVYSRLTGTTHLYYRQRHLGLPVYNAQLHFNIHRDGRILSVNNSFMPNIAAVAKSNAPTLGAEQAVASVAANLSVALAAPPLALSPPLDDAERRTLIEAPELSRATIDSQLAWVPVDGKQAALVWWFQVETLDGNHMFDYTVDADSGAVWTRFDWANTDSYRAYKEPVESANHADPPAPADGRVVVADPANPTASPLGWHDDGTTQFTIHRGNNVHAYDDRDANNAPPATEPACTASLDCDFPLDLASDPSTYTSAAVSNLFYWNNLIHDVQYQYGFDEEGGNFQFDNLGNGGDGADPVRAEAQDGTGTNNANFATPPDGSPPRMQMFEWTLTTPRRDGDLDNGIIVHEYGHGISIRQVGGPDNSSCLNNAQQGGEGWSDWFALWYTVEPGDAGTDARGIGTYALGEPTSGPGIRTQRYSTDPAVNNHTYESIDGMAIPHGVGEVWAQALWEVYWALVEQHGFDPDIYNAAGTAGNQRALLYINEGLKNTACSPTFVDARDGIIAAATAAHGGEDVCLLWEAFAEFGIGTDAVSGGPNSTSPTNGFELPLECTCNPAPIADAGPDQLICLGDSATVGTPAQPDNTYSWAPGGETTAEITVAPTETTVYTVTATTSCGSESDSVVVIVDDGSGGGFSDDFEGGAAGWTATGLWHLADNSTCASPGYSSPTHAFYYGQDATCTYDTGAQNSGDLTSPLITGITPSSVLSFDYLRQVESFGGAFDRTEVDVIRTDGSATNVFSLDSSDASTGVWTPSGDISLADFAGQAIQLRFRFDTGDAISNAFIGWFIDDVTVTTESACLLP
jgi:extracellular elastinolytic metalloproteinase